MAPRENIIDTLKASSNFSQDFIAHINEVYSHDKATIEDLIEHSTSESDIVVLQTKIFALLCDMLPAYCDFAPRTRRVKKKIAQDIYLQGYSVVNRSDDGRLKSTVTAKKPDLLERERASVADDEGATTDISLVEL